MKILICCKNKHSSSGRHIYLIMQAYNITNNCLSDKSSFSLLMEMPGEEQEGRQGLQLCKSYLAGAAGIGPLRGFCSNLKEQHHFGENGWKKRGKKRTIREASFHPCWLGARGNELRTSPCCL